MKGRTEDEWGKLVLQHRMERLDKLVRLNAPTYCIEHECYLVLQAIHHGNSKALCQLARWALSSWWEWQATRLKIWYWHNILRLTSEQMEARMEAELTK